MICVYVFYVVFAQNKEVVALREDHDHLVEMKAEVHRLHAVEHTYKLTTDRIAELELIIAQLMKDLEKEKLEKEAAVNEKEELKTESDLVRRVLCVTLIESPYRITLLLLSFICFTV